LENIRQLSWQEWVSTAMQILSVWYARKNNVLVYPTGIIGVLLAAYLYYFVSDPPLYADATLNLYYFFMSVYGWVQWNKRNERALQYPISWCTPIERIVGVLLGLIFWAGIAWILQYTDSNTVLLDALVSATAIVAMWWMAKRKTDHWMAWIASNLVAIPLNWYKSYYLFTVMYALFLFMALAGLLSWKKIMAGQSVKSTNP
jgi:nicotinamide mononucleotide transporter